MSSTAVDDQIIWPQPMHINRMWVVYVDYDQSTMSWKIGKVERWGPRAKVWEPHVLRIDDAKDELDAYAQALQMLEGAE